MEFYVFHQNNRKLAGVIETFEYLRWTRRYSRAGSFELIAIADPGNIALLQEGNIIRKSDDGEAGIIERVELSQTDREVIKASGRFATSLLARRIIWGTETLSGDLGAAVGQLLNRHLLSPADNDRKIAGMSYATAHWGISVQTQISFKNLMEAVCDLCDGLGMGVKTLFNPATGLFTVTLYAGGSASAVFSKEYENLTEQTYIQSVDEYANSALVGGEGEGSERQFVTIIQGAGENRREVFVDAKDLQSADFPGSYNDALLFRGQSRLSELAPRYSFDAGVNPHGNLRYKTDFNLGNTVKVIAKPWGVAMTARITEIEETYDADGLSLGIIFGKSELTLAQKMRSDMSDMKTSLLAPSGGGSGDIPDASVTTAKLAADAVTTEKIATGAVTAAEVADNAVTGAKIAAGAVGTAKIADNAVTSAKIADGAVATADLADLAVTAAKIANSTITSGKIASSGVATANIADGAVTSGKLAAGAVGTDKIADNAVTSAKIADGAVNTADLANESVTLEKINSGILPSTSNSYAQRLMTDTYQNGGAVDLNAFMTAGEYTLYSVTTATNFPTGTWTGSGNTPHLIVQRYYSSTAIRQILTKRNSPNDIWTRTASSASSWTAWYRIPAFNNAGEVATANLASGAVTTAKMAQEADTSITISWASGVSLAGTNNSYVNKGVVCLGFQILVGTAVAPGATMLTITNTNFRPYTTVRTVAIPVPTFVTNVPITIESNGVMKNGASGTTLPTGYYMICVTYARA